MHSHVQIPFRSFVRTNAGEMAEFQIEMMTENIKSVGVSILGGNSGVEGKYELGIDSVRFVNEEDMAESIGDPPLIYASFQSLLTVLVHSRRGNIGKIFDRRKTAIKFMLYDVYFYPRLPRYHLLALKPSHAIHMVFQSIRDAQKMAHTWLQSVRCPLIKYPKQRAETH